MRAASPSPAGHAIVGLSLPRENRTFAGLALDEALKARNAAPRCGLAIFDLASGDMAHWVRIEGVVRELYDVVALPGIRRPSAIGFRTDEVKRVISIEVQGLDQRLKPWPRPAAESRCPGLPGRRGASP